MQPRLLTVALITSCSTALAWSTLNALPAVAAATTPPATPANPTAATAELHASIAHQSALTADDPMTFDWENTFGEAIAKVAQHFPDDFSGSSIDPGGTSGEVRFKGAAPRKALDTIDGIENVRIVEHTGFNFSELDHYLDTILETASHEFEPGTILAVLVNDAEKTTDLYVANSTRSPLAQPRRTLINTGEHLSTIRTQRAVADANTPPFEDFHISIRSVDADTITTQASDGGRRFDYAIPGATRFCTGAFPVKSKSGPQIGILTAGHCSGTGTYDGVSNAFHPPIRNSYAMTDQSPAGDFRWNHSKHALSGWTYIGGTNRPRRQFSRVVYPAIGKRVCKYGVTSGYGCSQVTSVGKTTTVKVPGNTNSHRVGGLFCTAGNITAGGDSGGPWFSDDYAVGIHHGIVANKSCFSYVQFALVRFNLQLWTP